MAGGYGKKNSYYGGGYEVQKFGNVQLPAHMKCGRCKKMKKPMNYSEKQKRDYKQGMVQAGSRFDAKSFASVICMDCSPKQVVELQCDGCDKYLEVDKFYKAQRTKDAPLCIKCSTIKSSKEPDEEYEGGGNEDSDRDSDGGSRAGCSDEDDDDGGSLSYGGTYTSGSRSYATGTGTSTSGGVPLASAPSEPSGTPLPPHVKQAQVASAPLPPHASGRTNGSTPSVESATASMAKSTISDAGTRTTATASRAQSTVSTSARAGPRVTNTNDGRFAKLKAYKGPRRRDSSPDSPAGNNESDSSEDSVLSLG